MTLRSSSAILALVVASLITGATTGCAHNVYVVHPNSVSKTDSLVFDTMKAAQVAIEDAKKKRDQIPGLRAVLHDRIIPAYNVAEAAYIAYHKGLDVGKQPNPQTEADLLEQLLQVKADVGVALAGGKP